MKPFYFAKLYSVKEMNFDEKLITPSNGNFVIGGAGYGKIAKN